MIFKFATPTPRPIRTTGGARMPTMEPKPRIDAVEADTYREAVRKMCDQWRKEGVIQNV